jgi:hypothetical protein
MKNYILEIRQHLRSICDRVRAELSESQLHSKEEEIYLGGEAMVRHTASMLTW